LLSLNSAIHLNQHKEGGVALEVLVSKILQFQNLL
jgi:hypothetical protein